MIKFFQGTAEDLEEEVNNWSKETNHKYDVVSFFPLSKDVFVLIVKF